MLGFKYEMLMDNGCVPEYKCPVCGSLGLVHEHDALSDNSPEICRCCGAIILGGSNLDANSWYKIWREHGSKVLFDMPFEERSEYYRTLLEEYEVKHIYIPSRSDIENLTIEERAFTQNFFKKIIDHDKKIMIETGGKRYTFPYVTNTIFVVRDDSTYIAVAEKYDSKILFLSHEFQYNPNVYRTAYIGLLPDVFKLSMSLDETCEVEDNEGNTYVIYVK